TARRPAIYPEARMASTRTPVNLSIMEEGIAITRPADSVETEILTPDAIRFVAGLARRFTARRDQLLKLRAIRQKEIDSGHFPDFLADTAEIRPGDWKVAAVPHGVMDRR